MSTTDHGPAPDEKLCPFCAETIKAAAIRCRYCGSDLPPAEPPVDTGPPPTSSAAEEPDPPVVEVRGPWSRRREPASGLETRASTPPAVAEPLRSGLFASRTLTTALVVLVVVAALALFLVGRSAARSDVAPDGQLTSAATRSVLLDQAGKMTAKALSYGATTFDKDTAAARALMTSSMRAQYDQTLAQVRSKVRQRGLVLKATVRWEGLISATNDQARVLVFVNQTTTARGVKTQQLNESRLVVTLAHQGGRWLMSNLDTF